MAQIRNRFDIQNQIDDEKTINIAKRIPNFFTSSNDELGFMEGMIASVLTHIVFICCLLLVTLISGLVFPQFKKPELQKKDIVFKLVQNESKPPINKNTKIRSDRDSQAGGKHDPKKAISEPSPKPAASNKKTEPPKKSQPQPQKTVTQNKPMQNKPQLKPAIKQPVKTVQAPQQPAKPSAVKAPSAIKPAVKPAQSSSNVAKPSAPKIASKPNSPFSVPVPPSKAPVGNVYKPQGTSGSSNNGAASGGAKGAPSPKFSSSGSSSGGSSTGSSSRYASRGSSSGGNNIGNPSPGNPNGTPGIDALKQPNWGPYMKDLEQRIKRNWTPPKNDTSRRVVITFTIGRDGRLLSHKITKSSGIPLVDQAAMSAIELTAPFRPLPPEFKGQSVPIEFTFDYNVLNSVLR